MGPSRRWQLAALVGLLAIVLLAVGYVRTVRLIDAEMQQAPVEVSPRVFARPFELYVGQALDRRQLFARLNAMGYQRRSRAELGGEFAAAGDFVSLVPLGGPHRNTLIAVTFEQDAHFTADMPFGEAPLAGERIRALESGGQVVSGITLEPPLLTILSGTTREKRRWIPLSRIPDRMVQAVLAIEDRRFYEHYGVDPVRTAAAVMTNLRGDTPYLVGGSTLTQQLVKNLFLTPDKTIRRKLTEQIMALILERRVTKDQILERYLNEVYLGQRGSFAIHGVAEGARIYFGKDVTNLTVAEAATLAGIIQSPPALSPFTAPTRALDRRNVVVNAMVDAGYLTTDAAVRAMREPLTLAPRALDAEAPYFVDFVAERVAEEFPTLPSDLSGLDIHTTLDLHLQHVAEGAVLAGLSRVEGLLAERDPARGTDAAMPQAALIAVDPRTGDILAMVGGRSYNQSQFNRVTRARRQPGSVFKPFVYLAALDDAAQRGDASLTPSAIVLDEPTTFVNGEEHWTPANYGGRYDGPMTLRQALARSRNVPAVKVAQQVGYGRVADLWRRIDVGTDPQPYPSIALGVFEATPYEIAQAYTLFPNGGRVRPLRAIAEVIHSSGVVDPAAPSDFGVARPDATFLVTNMLRSVIEEGTAAAARRAGLQADVAGKTGSTNDLRDAWFAGFSSELLAIVWVGLDDNGRLGLEGSQAALPIWTTFMNAALAGRASPPFAVPESVRFVEIDADSGKLATGDCPHVITEAYVVGTEPLERCPLPH